MMDLTIALWLVYALIAVIIGGIGLYVDAEEIAKPYTDIGTAWAIVALAWPLVLCALPIVLVVITAIWLNMKIVNKIVIYKRRVKEQQNDY